MAKRRGVAVSCVLAVFLALALGAVARAGINITYPDGPDPAVREWPSWPGPVSCGGLDFDPVSAFGGETGAEDGPGAPEQALRRIIDERPPGMPTRFWRVMAATETRVEFAQGRLSQGPFTLSLELLGGQWRLAGLPGYCVPQTVREGSELARWRIDGSQALTPGTRRIKVNLSAGSGGCDGGRSLNAAAGTPLFRQVGKRLAMTIWLQPLPPGPYTCEKRIEPPLSVRLPGRLGDRRLFDGGSYPPKPRK